MSSDASWFMSAMAGVAVLVVFALIGVYCGGKDEAPPLPVKCECVCPVKP